MKADTHYNSLFLVALTLNNKKMKRFNSQSVARKVKRNLLRFIEIPFIKNEDGTNKIIMQRRTSRGRWVNS